MEEIQLEIKNREILVIGMINFDNVTSILNQGITMIGGLGNVKVNLKELRYTDSSGLALFVAWVKTAKQQNKNIVFTSVPNFVKDIARVYGLDNVLPVSWEN